MSATNTEREKLLRKLETNPGFIGEVESRAEMDAKRCEADFEWIVFEEANEYTIYRCSAGGHMCIRWKKTKKKPLKKQRVVTTSGDMVDDTGLPQDMPVI